MDRKDLEARLEIGLQEADKEIAKGKPNTPTHKKAVEDRKNIVQVYDVWNSFRKLQHNTVGGNKRGSRLKTVVWGKDEIGFLKTEMMHGDFVNVGGYIGVTDWVGITRKGNSSKILNNRTTKGVKRFASTC